MDGGVNFVRNCGGGGFLLSSTSFFILRLLGIIFFPGVERLEHYFLFLFFSLSSFLGWHFLLFRVSLLLHSGIILSLG